MNDKLYQNQNLLISNESAELLESISKWTRFLAVLAFVLIIIMALTVIGAAVMITSVNHYEMVQSFGYYHPGIVSWPYVIFYMILLVIYTLPAYYLYKFSSKTKEALYTGNSAVLTDAVRFLKRHYSIIGIFTIIWLVMIIVMMIMMTAGVMRAGF